MHIVHSVRKGPKVKQLLIATLGRYDEVRYTELQSLLRDWQRLERVRVMVDEINDSTTPVTQYFCAGTCVRRHRNG